jgi:hypothetical protein
LRKIKRCGHSRRCISRVEKPDHRHHRLLRVGNERPCGHTAKQRDKLAPSHSITSSASESSMGDGSIPSERDSCQIDAGTAEALDQGPHSLAL